MKKLFTLLCVCITCTGMQAQYQIQNSGFEEWENVSYNTYNGVEPIGWNSFLTGTGSLKGTAGRNQLEESNEPRPGSAGTKSAKLFARKVLGSIFAQGNLTTGCINMASMTANDAKGNYNYTKTDDDNLNQKFTGRPDAMHVWIKYYSTTTANPYGKVNTILHTAGYYQDPMGNESNITARLVATAEKTDITSSNEWQELTIPFTYEAGTDRPAYALVSFATNTTPGKGSEGDYMLVDDLEYIYNSELNSLTYNNVPIYESNKTHYDLSDEAYSIEKLSCTSNGIGAVIEKSYNEETSILTLTVKGDDWSEDNKNEHTYTIQFKKEAKQPTIENFSNPLLVSINGEATDPQDTDIQLITEADGTFTFALNNFMLGSGEDVIAVGNIRLTHLENSGNTYTAEQTIQIEAGDQEGISDWLGPILGDVPVKLTATRNGDNLTADIDIDMSSTLSQVIKVTFAPGLVINEAQTLDITEKSLYNVTLSRTFNKGWNTVCLPFATTPEQLGATQAQAFTAFNGTVLTFEKTESMAAHTPYLLYFENAPSSERYFGCTIAPTSPKNVTLGQVTFTGNYTADMSMNGLYGVAEKADGTQCVMPGGANSKLGCTCAYFTLDGAQVNFLRINLDGTETDIAGIKTEQAGTAFDVFTLSGTKVRSQATTTDGLRKGIYIINGKKLIVK